VTRVIKLFEPKVMFEPFLGSGTTVGVAKYHGVSIVGTDLSLDNVNTAYKKYIIVEAQTRVKELGDKLSQLQVGSTIAKEWKHLPW
jgi:DNA modification methylase